MRQPLTVAELANMRYSELNAGLRNYREDLRYTREDAVNYAKLWNAAKLSTQATVVTVDGFPQVIVVNV
jgi:hypothetical protein